MRLGPLPLATGTYELYFWLARPWAEEYHAPKEPLSFDIVHSDPCGTGFDFQSAYGRGAVTFPLTWEHDVTPG
jgi:hypothetical protein